MNEKMSWKECVDQGIIIKTVPDEERASQMLNIANLRLKFWDKPIDDKFVALKVEAYYDIIKELIFSHIYKDGLNCTNHICLIAYLRNQKPNRRKRRGIILHWVFGHKNIQGI